MPQTPTGAASDAHVHFTYTSQLEDDLCQGDVLRKTEPMVRLLEEVHPHYLQEDYSHFLVLTQSCDLVRRRDGYGCKARYVTLAPTRPLELLIRREIGKRQKPLDKAANACSKGARQSLVGFLERLLNNNNPEYFYLHPEAELGFPEAQCAFLRLSIGLRAYEHYDTCLDARALSLTDVFKAKLGWLVGNMYSRVGTEDWVPRYDTEEEFGRRIDLLLDEACDMWVEDKVLRAARESAATEVLQAGGDMARKHIEGTVVPKRRDVVLGRVEAALREMNIVTEDKVAERIRRRLGNDPEFAGSTK